MPAIQTPHFLPCPPMPADADLHDADLHDDVLLDWAEPLDGAHALVVGHGALPMIAGLIRRGCIAATEIQPDCRLSPDANSADLVIAARVESAAEARVAVAWAARALVLGGRVALRDGTGHLWQEVAAMLRTYGFQGVRTHRRPEGVLVTAERPLFGPLHRA